MSSIDEVIARSQQQGTFTERRTFTVARQSAIQKMRKFALADPHYYVLELIQSAIANGGTYIDLDIQDNSVRMSYVGGGFTESELSQLFDFLFASKDDLDIADVRQLALGINALLLAKPELIAIESGDGTLEGTTRVEIVTADDSVTVGRPERPLQGTFVSVMGLHRRLLGGGGKIRELNVIETRCLSAMIPIIVNNDPLFGYSTVRVPKLFGYPRSIEFDEGDLYGSIGIATTSYSENFKMLTWGVWVESVKYDLLPGHRLGGVVAFDRLRKTADHGSIVQDEVFDEMWTRLRPYARQLIDGKTGAATFDIRLLDGDGKLTATQIRELIAQAGGAVSLRETAVRSSEKRELARKFGEALDVAVFVSSNDDEGTVQLLAGEHFVLQPKLTDFELDFYAGDLAEDPPRPWAIGAVELDSFTLAELADWLGDRNGVLTDVPDSTVRRWMSELGGRNDEIRATVFAPTERSRSAHLEVEVRTAGRTVWRGDIASSFPGHTLVIEFKSASPTRLNASHKKRALAELIAVQVELHSTARLEEATRLALSTLDQRDPDPNSALARITLGALARGTMKRLRTASDGAQRIVFTILSDELDQRALRVPLVRTMSGKPITGLDLEEMLEAQHGLIYGVVPEVPADLTGIDPDCVLDLDLAAEQMLVTLVGEGSYVRIDSRDVLADMHGVKVRDIYLGQGERPDTALICDGAASLDEEAEIEIVQRLMSIFLGSTREAEDDTELRRQASRHLVWYLATKTAHGAERPTWIDEVPIFRAGSGTTASFSQIVDALLAGELRMADGWSIDCADLAILGAESDPDAAYDTIAMNPFVYHALRQVAPIHATMDFAVGKEVSLEGLEMLVDMQIESTNGRGLLGIPAHRLPNPSIALVDSSNQTVGTIESLASRFGVVGMVHLTADGSNNRSRVAAEVHRICRALMNKLVMRLPAGEAGRNHVVHLLEYASGGFEFTRTPWGDVELSVQDSISSEILELPLFPTEHGVAVSAYRFLREFAIYGVDPDVGTGRAQLAADAPDYLVAWLREQLDPNRIHSPASNQMVDEARETFTAEQVRNADELAEWIKMMIVRLRPDDLEANGETIIEFVRPNDRGKVTLSSRIIVDMGPSEMIGYADWNDRRSIYFNADHPVVAAAIAEPNDEQRRVWLLLSAYGQLNYSYTVVTNRHEIEFQSRVLALL